MDSNETPKKLTLRHFIIKLSKSKNFDKERILERIKFVTYKGTPRRLLSYFSAEEIKRTGSKRWEGKKKRQTKNVLSSKTIFQK